MLQIPNRCHIIIPHTHVTPPPPTIFLKLFHSLRVWACIWFEAAAQLLQPLSAEQPPPPF